MAIGLVAFSLLGAHASEPPRAAAALSQTHLVAVLGLNCLEGHLWPGDTVVDVQLTDSGGIVVFTAATTTDSTGNFVVNQNANRFGCAMPVPLSPGMTFSASDGTTTKSLVLENISFDQLDPQTETAAGTAPPGRLVQVYAYWDTSGQDLSVNANQEAGAGGDWSVDVAALGGKVEPTSRGDAFLTDDGADGNVDFTRASLWATALTLSTSVSGSSLSAASGASVARPGKRVRLAGKLSADTAGCVSGKRVRLLKLTGKTTKVLATGQTSRLGGYSFTQRIKRTTSFRVRYPGNRTCQGSTSRVKTVRLR